MVPICMAGLFCPDRSDTSELPRKLYNGERNRGPKNNATGGVNDALCLCTRQSTHRSENPNAENRSAEDQRLKCERRPAEEYRNKSKDIKKLRQHCFAPSGCRRELRPG